MKVDPWQGSSVFCISLFFSIVLNKVGAKCAYEEKMYLHSDNLHYATLPLSISAPSLFDSLYLAPSLSPRRLRQRLVP